METPIEEEALKRVRFLHTSASAYVVPENQEGILRSDEDIYGFHESWTTLLDTILLR